MSYSKRFERNLGFYSAYEQEKLHNSTVAIAGAGGDGGMLAVQLARLGIGNLKLADPDPFEIENINRQAVCTEETIGMNKAIAVGDYLKKINPEINLEIYDEGITIDNTERFLEGVDLLIDETEFTLHALAICLAREARRRKVPNLTAFNVGFGAVVTTYKPDGPSVESRLGFSDTQDIDEIKSTQVPLSRWVPYLPKYVDLEVFEKVAKGEKSAPSVAPGVAIAAGVAATQATLNLISNQNKRKSPVYAPDALVFDAMSGIAKKIKYNRTSHYRHLTEVVLRNIAKTNPKADY